MITFTIIALLVVSLTLLAWIVCLFRHTNEQEEFINFLVSRGMDQQYSIECLEIMHETALNHANDSTDWIAQLQAEILDLEDQVRDTNNELYVRKAEVEQLQWNLSTYESVCNPNTEVEDELAIARRCIWDKEHQLSSLKFQVSLVKEVLLGLETKIGKEEPNLFEISSDLRWAIASISHDEIPF